MLQHYQRGPISYSSAVPTNTGDGILMGMGIGADLRNMNNSWGWPTYKTPRGGIPDAGLERGKPGSIYVNRFGERFCNEAASYPLVNRTFFVWDTRIYGYRNIPAFAIIDSEHRSRYSLAGIPPGETVPEWLRMANTLRELAGLLGIDPDGLERTVQLFNASAREGVDPEFHRGEFHFDRITAGDLSREDVNNPSLAPVEKPPFYGLEVSPGLLGTNGGLRINTKAEVRDVFGKVIPRLYATGNAAGNPFGPSYPGGGATIGFATVFGYIAGRNAAAQSSL
jgi:succinate dehydrogenase/fumarate reductase flavoprotein subunit